MFKVRFKARFSDKITKAKKFCIVFPPVTNIAHTCRRKSRMHVQVWNVNSRSWARGSTWKHRPSLMWQKINTATVVPEESCGCWCLPSYHMFNTTTLCPVVKTRKENTHRCCFFNIVFCFCVVRVYFGSSESKLKFSFSMRFLTCKQCWILFLWLTRKLCALSSGNVQSTDIWHPKVQEERFLCSDTSFQVRQAHYTIVPCMCRLLLCFFSLKDLLLHWQHTFWCFKC